MGDTRRTSAERHCGTQTTPQHHHAPRHPRRLHEVALNWTGVAAPPPCVVLDLTFLPLRTAKRDVLTACRVGQIRRRHARRPAQGLRDLPPPTTEAVPPTA